MEGANLLLPVGAPSLVGGRPGPRQGGDSDPWFAIGLNEGDLVPQKLTFTLPS